MEPDVNQQYKASLLWEDKADALAQKMIGNDEKQMQGYKDRSEIREVMGDRLAREIVLEPKEKWGREL